MYCNICFGFFFGSAFWLENYYLRLPYWIDTNQEYKEYAGWMLYKEVFIDLPKSIIKEKRSIGAFLKVHD